MQQVPLQAVPNQTFTITIDMIIFDISMRVTNGVMSASITINNVLTIENLRVVAGQCLLPSKYEEAGNFRFSTLNDDLPDYTQFNITQYLYYFSADELATLRSEVTPPIVSGNFNPFAALPLRFSPQGY